MKVMITGGMGVMGAEASRRFVHEGHRPVIFARHRDEWLVFLNDPEVPATNNHAERMLRPAVITRKIGGCNKTLLGALVHSILASIMVTCHRRGKRFLDLARQLWQSSQPQAIPVDTLPQPTS